MYFLHVWSCHKQAGQLSCQLKTTLLLLRVQVNFWHAALYLNEMFQALVTTNYKLPPRGEEISVPPCRQGLYSQWAVSYFSLPICG